MTALPDDQRWLQRIGASADAPDDPGGSPPAYGEATDPAGDLETNDRVDIVDLDTGRAAPENPNHAARRFTPWVAALFGVVAAIATTITAGAAALTFRDPAQAPAPKPARTAQPAIPAPPSTSATNADRPIPFTASADCPPGSTAAQSVADPQAKTPWICARTVDGQVLHIDLGRAYVITAVSIVPGAIRGEDDQSDPWLQHRVVTRIQWQFNDTDKTVRNQNTGDVRGEAVLPVPDVLASGVTAIIQQTSRPPAAAPTTSPQGNGAFGTLLATQPTQTQLPGDPPPSDPSDGTFAVTSVKIIGHQAT